MERETEKTRERGRKEGSVRVLCAWKKVCLRVFVRERDRERMQFLNNLSSMNVAWTWNQCNLLLFLLFFRPKHLFSASDKSSFQSTPFVIAFLLTKLFYVLDHPSMLEFCITLLALFFGAKPVILEQFFSWHFPALKLNVVNC